MSTLDPDSLHQAVRQALNAGDFDAARQLGEALGAAISRELAAAPPTQRPALCAERLSLLKENLSLVRVLRSHLASRLQTNTAVWVYQPFSDAHGSWNFDA